jgi:hypothetical protein
MPRLTSQPIVNFANINDFQESSQWTIRATDQQTLYFQLFDLDNSFTSPFAALNSGFFNAAIQTTFQRYIAGVGVSNQPVVMTVTFPSLNIGKTFTFTATQDPNDGSVFSFNLPGYLNAGLSPSSGNVEFTLTQGTVTWKWTVKNMLAVEMTNQGSC